jgi:hypothetical protein
VNFALRETNWHSLERRSKKAAEAQQKSELALSKQARSLIFSARLNSTSALLSAYEGRHSSAMTRGDSVEIRIAELSREKFRMSLEALADEITYANLCELGNSLFPVVTAFKMLKVRIVNELSRIQRNYYDDFQFRSLFNSIEQQVIGILPFASEFPLEIKSLIMKVLEELLTIGNQVQPGSKGDLQVRLKGCEAILKTIDRIADESNALLAETNRA